MSLRATNEVVFGAERTERNQIDKMGTPLSARVPSNGAGSLGGRGGATLTDYAGFWFQMGRGGRATTGRLFLEPQGLPSAWPGRWWPSKP